MTKGGAVTLGIYVVIWFIPVILGPAAVGQSSTHVKTFKPFPAVIIVDPVPIRPSFDGYVPPGRRLELAALPPPQPVVMHREIGGSILEHETRFRTISRSGAKVELRGGCYSACTLITGYIPKERMCFGQSAFLAFHAATHDAERRSYAMQSTANMYMTYPAEIKAWIDRKGGWEHLTVGEYWMLSASDLWAMGYPKCQ